jgi:hypothetical protein
VTLQGLLLRANVRIDIQAKNIIISAKDESIFHDWAEDEED